MSGENTLKMPRHALRTLQPLKRLAQRRLAKPIPDISYKKSRNF